jgi:hypothetical protein
MEKVITNIERTLEEMKRQALLEGKAGGQVGRQN